MANKKIYKNRLSLPIFDNKGMGNGNGIAYVPNIIRGGSAIPIGNNMFFMKGKSHNQGGIDIGKDLEVERNEVVQNGKFGTRVFSSVPFLRGVSPAQRVLQGENPDAVFAAQENWKRINKINDDGSRKAALGINLFRPNSFKVQELPIDNFLANSINREIETPEVPTYVLKDDEKPVGKKVNSNDIGGGRLYNGYAVDNHEGENVNGVGGGRVYNNTPTSTTHAIPRKNKYTEEEIYNQRKTGLDLALDELNVPFKDREKYYNLLIPQSVLEPGWTIPSDNNYFGHLKTVNGKRVKIKYNNPKDAWLAHIKNLNRKWPNWITANNQKEYFDIINNEALGLHTLQDWEDYVAKNPTKNAYIYAPAWENNIQQYVDSLSNISNKFNKYKAFGGDKTYVAPKWAQDSYKKYGKVVIGGEPLGIGLGAGRIGTFTGLMRNNLLRSAFRNFKKYGSRASTIIKDSYYDLTDALARPFIRSEKAYKTFKKVRGIGYDTLFGDRRLDGTVKTGKGDFEFFSNLSRLPITFNETNNIINGEKQFGGMKLNIFNLGGLSRSKDYGSKDKPYPSVDKNDFAGGGRSYPIPTRADAVDALRLAGLHHRSDVRAKVYAKYPDLRKKAAAGTDIKFDMYNGTPNNNDGLVVGDNLSFNQAFGTARRAGFHTFTWRGKKYTTELADSSVDNNTYEGGTLPDLVVTGNRGRNANTILLREQNEDKLNENNKTPIIAENNTSNKKQSNSSAGLNSKIIDIIAGSTVGKWFRNKKFNWTPTPREDYNPAEHPSRNIFVEGMKKQIEFNDALKRDWNKYKESRKNNSIRTNVLGRREIPTPGTFDGGEFGGGGAGSKFGYTPKKDKDEEYKFIPVPVSVKRTFNEAFADARKKGLKTFDFNGKKYTTELGNNPKSQSAGNRRFESRLDIALIPIKKKEENKKGTNEDIIKKVNAVIDKHPGFGGGGAGSKFSFGGRKIAKNGIYTPEEIANITDEELLRRIIDPTTDPLWSRSKYNPNSYNYSFIEDRLSRRKRNKAVEAARNRLSELRPSISVDRARELFRGDSSKNVPEFYQREDRPMFETNPLVSRFYNYGWSHNAGAEVPYLINSTNVNNISNTSTPVQTSTSRQVAKTATQKNNIPAVSPAAQRILDNAELAPYQNFSHPTLAEVAGRYPISERVGSSTSVTPISSSTGNGTNPADVEAVRSGNFKAIDNDRYVPIHTTTEDWVGLGANLLGSIGSYLGTRAMLNRYPMPSKPVPAIAQKLKTRFNINSALDQIREQAGTLGRMVDNNTASSRVAQARKQGISNNATASTNQQYNQKENIETQLINQDIMNRQRVGLYNNQVYNNWLDNLFNTRRYVADAKIGNFNNVLSGANQSVQDLLGRIEGRNALGRNLIFMQAAYPDVNWRNIFQNNRELARSFGFRFLNN